MISVKLNKELDSTTYSDFRNFSIGGIDFGQKIHEDHPLISIKNYKRYIDEFYHEHADGMSRSLTEINFALYEKEDDFKTFIKKYFGSLSTNNNGVGYLSIFNCNPRFLKKKSFQIYYKKSLLLKLGVCFHETLHFQFFDYCDKYLSKETCKLDKNSGKLWELSEIFNVILMNESCFKKILDKEEKLFYPDLREKLTIAKDIWTTSNHDIKQFIKKYLSVSKD